MNPYIVVIDDDEGFREYLHDILTENEYRVQTFSRGITALKAIEKSSPDLVILDLKLPDMTGESVCLEIRKNYPSLPIVMLTAKDGISDKVYGLRIGADDYITKPFATDEFIARINVRLRNKKNGHSKIRVGDLELSTETFEVKRKNKVRNLTPQEFKLLEYLMRNKGIVLTREMILNRIWLYSPDVESRVVDVYMGYLRKKIDSGFKKKLIHSIRGFGYSIRD